MTDEGVLIPVHNSARSKATNLDHEEQTAQKACRAKFF